MSQLPVASVTVDFDTPVSFENIQLALIQLGLRKSLQDFFDQNGYLLWTSRRLVDGRYYYRLGFQDSRSKDARVLGTYNYDILVVPKDGKSEEWFAVDSHYSAVAVRSRACSDSWSEPLRDKFSDEMKLCENVVCLAEALQSVRQPIVAH